MVSSFDLVIRGAGDGTEPPPDCVVPFIDDRSLDELVAEFEEAQGHDTPGGYDGLIPAYFRFGPLLLHYMGQSDMARNGTVPVLGCQCGEWGCWPLEVRVDVRRTTVVWSGFEQPYRPDRTYDGFGPFTFDLRQYEAAATNVAAALDHHGA